MIIIPAVDIKQGQCVRLREGKAEAVTIFSDDPAQMARQWVSQGAERLHVVDLDGAFEKGPRNFSLIEKLVRSVSIPVQLGGGLRDLKTIARYLQAGVAQVILGTIAQKQPSLAQEACRLFPGRIIIGIDARNNRVAVEGWTEVTSQDPLDLGRKYEDWGVRAIIYTDIRRDGTQKGPAQRSTQRSGPGSASPGYCRRRDCHPGRCSKDGPVGKIWGGGADNRKSDLQRFLTLAGGHPLA